MKKIEINFVDFWPNFDKKDNIIYKILTKNFEVEFSQKPKYVFCSLFGKEHFKYNDAIKILVIGENIAPDFNLYDYVIGLYDISFKDRYLKYNILIEEEMVNLIKNRKKEIKEKFCCFVYRKNELNNMRLHIFNTLNEYKKVDSGGKYKNNIGYNIGKRKIDKINFQKQYKFIIACENQTYPEYNTEKLLEAFASGGIPIYWGDPNITNIYNKNAFINCNDFDNLEDLKNKVIELDEDNKKYLEMLNQSVFNKNYDFYNEKFKLENFLNNIFSQEYIKAKRVKLDRNYYIYNFYKIYFGVNFIWDKFYKLKQFIKSIINK